jgi:hypothetical protein
MVDIVPNEKTKFFQMIDVGNMKIPIEMFGSFDESDGAFY